MLVPLLAYSFSFMFVYEIHSRVVLMLRDKENLNNLYIKHKSPHMLLLCSMLPEISILHTFPGIPRNFTRAFTTIPILPICSVRKRILNHKPETFLQKPQNLFFCKPWDIQILVHSMLLRIKEGRINTFPSRVIKPTRFS